MQRSNNTSLTSRSMAAGCLGFLLAGSTAFADALVMEPAQINLSASHPVSELKFRNDSADETTLNFEVSEWQQDGDREWFSLSRRLIVVPERVTLQAGESGKVRVSLRLSGPWWEEEAFKIMVTQTARIPDVGDKAGHTSGNRMIRPSSVPVFLLPPGKANPRLAWSFERNSLGAVVLSARNDGKGHIRLNSANLLGPAGQAIQKPSMSDVILPGGARSWEFASEVAAGTWHLIADTDAGPVRVQFELRPDNSAERALTFSQ